MKEQDKYANVTRGLAKKAKKARLRKKVAKLLTAYGIREVLTAIAETWPTEEEIRG